MQNSPYESGGIVGPNQKALMQALQGGTAGVQVPGMQSDAAAPSPALDFGRMAGYDQGKWDANKQDAKYQMGRTLAQFDPRQGITPDVLAGLNGLGYGTFSGQGDKLSLSGLTDKGRQNKLSGDYSGADFIQGFKSGNGKWGYADPVAEAAEAQSQPQMRSAAPMGGDLQSLLGGGDASQGIEQALAQYTQRSPNLMALLSQLGGGQ